MVYKILENLRKDLECDQSRRQNAITIPILLKENACTIMFRLHDKLFYYHAVVCVV